MSFLRDLISTDELIRLFLLLVTFLLATIGGTILTNSIRRDHSPMRKWFMFAVILQWLVIFGNYVSQVGSPLTREMEHGWLAVLGFVLICLLFAFLISREMGKS